MKNLILLSCIAFLFLAGCDKLATEKVEIYKAEIPPASPISDAAPLCGSIKGTMLAGKKYTLGCDVVINEGDTLIIQEGVRINVPSVAGFAVKGVLICLGTKEKPNWITVDGVAKTDKPGVDPAKDPAYQGLWRGIVAATTCPLLVIKWTHIEFGGGAAGPIIGPLLGVAASKNAYDIFFQNPQGVFILEDSWLYGSVDDPIRIVGGKIGMYRNTFEKCGYTGGEAVNIKGGTVGDFAYNVCIGMATNGPKASNNGGSNIQSNLRFYNNTIVNCGFRRLATGRGGSINYEEGAKGMFYNNLMVNCKYGPRVVKSPPADTANVFYGYNYNYGDSLSIANQFIPPTYLTKAQATDIPNPYTYLPAGWKIGDAYNGAKVVGQNNPMFINGPVPLPAGLNFRDINTVDNYNFGLKPGSPAIGKGFTGFTALGVVPVHPKYGATEITQPGRDIGAYQTNGTGNNH